jgi:hypothetical protein
MWPITSIDGAITYNETATVWGNQHNPEFIDDDEICMFDCTGLGNESRLLTVKVNETNQTARLTWEARRVAGRAPMSFLLLLLRRLRFVLVAPSSASASSSSSSSSSSSYSSSSSSSYSSSSSSYSVFFLFVFFVCVF